MRNGVLVGYSSETEFHEIIKIDRRPMLAVQTVEAVSGDKGESVELPEQLFTRLRNPLDALALQDLEFKDGAIREKFPKPRVKPN